MRIGLVCYAYPPQAGTGGVGTYMFRLAGALGQAGHRVHVVAGPSDRPAIEQPNVTVHRVAARFDIRTRSRIVNWLGSHTLAPAMARMHPVIWHLMRWNVASLDGIAEVDRRFGLDVVEAPEFAGNGLMAGQLHRWPMVFRMHCPWELFCRINRFRFNPMNRVLGFLERWAIANCADAITAPSFAMKREAEKNWKLRRPIRVIPNFMDVPPEPAPLPDEAEPQRIVCAARIERLKGQDALAQAFALIAKAHPRAELWLIGPDSWGGPRPFAKMLQTLVPDRDIRARIQLPGAMPFTECERHIRRSRVAVVSSRGFESFSLSALEMMATARPLVVTDAGALPELIDHEQTGLVVRASNAHAMAVALDRMLADRQFAQGCALAAHATARQRYDTPRVLPQMLGAYQEAADFYYGVGTVTPPPRALAKPAA